MKCSMTVVKTLAKRVEEPPPHLTEIKWTAMEEQTQGAEGNTIQNADIGSSGTLQTTPELVVCELGEPITMGLFPGV